MHIDYWRSVRQNNFAKIGFSLIAIILFAAIASPLITQYQPADYTGNIFISPSWKNILGTNDVGQDIFSHLVYGARTSLIIGCSTALLSTLISLFIGGLAALLGGIYDRLLLRFVDAMIIIPPIIVIILVSSYIKPGLVILILLLSAFIWPGGARVVRAQTLMLKEKTHVPASRAFGSGFIHILVRHIIPELGPILIVIMIQDIRRAVFMEAGLSFLGISDPSMISWGKMIQHASKFYYLDVWMWWLIPAGLALTFVVLGFALIGFSLESALDPRLKDEQSQLFKKRY